MAIKLGDAVLFLTSNSADLKKSLKASEGEVQGFGSRVSGFLSNAFSFAVGGLIQKGIEGIGRALSGLTSGALEAAMEAQNIQAGLNAVLESTGGVAGMTAESVNALALALSEVTPFEDDAIVAGESLLLTFTNVGADVFPMATEAMLNMSQALGQDLKTSATQVGKALNNPIAGMAALTRVGIQFTDAQKAQIKALQASGDLLGAQNIILGELEKKFGGAARAAGQTFAGKLTILKNALGNVKEAIGTALLPILSKLITKYGPALIAFAKNSASWFTDKLAPAVDKVLDIVNELIDNWGALGDFPWEDILPDWAVGAAYGIANALESLFSGTLPAVLAFLKTKFDEVLPRLVELKNAVSTGLTQAAALLKIAWDKYLFPALETFYGKLKDIAESAWPKVRAALEDFRDYLQNKLPLAAAWTAMVLNTILVPAFRDLGAVLADPVALHTGTVATNLERIQVVGLMLKELLGNLGQLFATVGEALGRIRVNLPGVNVNLSMFGTVSSRVALVLDVIQDLLARINSWLEKYIENLRIALGLQLPTGPASGGGGSGFAGGTSFFGGGLALVGERGPEMVALPRGSRIYPHGQGPGNTFNITINAPGGDPYAVARATEQGVQAALSSLGVSGAL